MNIKNKFSFANLGDMILQGICSVGDNIFITAYSDIKRNSVVYIFNKDNVCIKETILYNNSHVGGICFDDKNNLFWITDKGGTISGYTYDSIINSKEVCFPIFKQVDVGSLDLINYEGISSVAYITYYDNKIYLGNFTTNGTGLLKVFDILSDGNIDLNNFKKVKFLDKVQGISVYNSYLFVSCSYGRNNSKLKIFKYSDNILDYNKEKFIEYDMPMMIEQISFDKDNFLLTVYESNAKKYKKLFSKNNDVIIYDISNINFDILLLNN